MLPNYIFAEITEKDLGESLPTAVELEQPGEDPTMGIDTAPSPKRHPDFYELMTSTLLTMSD